MTNEVRIYLGLYGEEDFIPEDFSKKSGLTPTSQWRKGDPGKYIAQQKHSGWEFSTSKIKNDFLDIEEIADNLISKISDKTQEIKETIEKYNLSAFLEVVLHISMDDEISTPALGFSKKTIKFLNKINAEIDVDIYRN